MGGWLDRPCDPDLLTHSLSFSLGRILPHATVHAPCKCMKGPTPQLPPVIVWRFFQTDWLVSCTLHVIICLSTQILKLKDKYGKATVLDHWQTCIISVH